MTSVLETSGLMKTLAYVGGAGSAPDSGATFPVYDPATRKLIADVPRSVRRRRGARSRRRTRLCPLGARPRRRTREDHTALVDLIVRTYGRTRAHHDARTGQARSRKAR